MTNEGTGDGMVITAGSIARRIRWLTSTRVAAAMLCLVAVQAQAAWTTPFRIKILKMQENGVFLRLDGFVNSDTAISCGSNDFFLLKDEPTFRERVTFLLMAQASSRPVKVSYYGCSGANIKLGSVSLEGDV